jgi:hypothetical protein
MTTDNRTDEQRRLDAEAFDAAERFARAICARQVRGGLAQFQLGDGAHVTVFAVVDAPHIVQMIADVLERNEAPGYVVNVDDAPTMSKGSA